MECLQGDLSGIFTPEVAVPMAAKEYATRRLVLEPQHMQRAGFSHNDLKLENYFVLEDGSFLVGDFGSDTPICEPLNRFSGNIPLYTEAELCIAAVGKVRTVPIVDAKSDTWALGINLYRMIFMDSKLPNTLGQPGSTAENSTSYS